MRRRGEALAETECPLHAYALMTNHGHLLLTPKTATTEPRLLMSLGRRYVQYISRTHNRTGTLWDSRYKSSVVQADDPAHYRWKSYRHNGLRKADGRDTAPPIYDGLGLGEKSRQSGYRELFRAA